ncbi:MAG: AmmeMemoRadiSam system protein B [Anaerolineae bacterium]|nr:AmmeMemoRadiSam system protein B [Anaerolineae bacterium]
MNPKLRSIRPELATVNGRPVVLLRDPLGLSDQTVAVPHALAPLLTLCDGTRDESAVRAALQVRHGIYLSPDRLAEILQRLDEALLLDNDTFRLARVRALNAYRTAPCRPPALAGQSYPADPQELAALLDGLVANVPRPGISLLARGLVSPHIDYQRGGAVYAEVWSRVAASARRADVAVILGTDHQSEDALLTVTRQSYSTPFGRLPTDIPAVEAVGDALEGAAWAEELHHRTEHSIELAAVWLHHVRRGEPIPLVPILCGSFSRFVTGGEDPAADASLNRAIVALRGALTGRRAFVVAAGDLAHSGTAFGDAIPAGPATRAHGAQADTELLGTIVRGDAAGFYAHVKAEEDRRHICGLPPIYLALRLLEPVRGEPAGYAQVPADAHGTSFVSIAGVALL